VRLARRDRRDAYPTSREALFSDIKSTISTDLVKIVAKKISHTLTNRTISSFLLLLTMDFEIKSCGFEIASLCLGYRVARELRSSQ